MFFRGVTWLRDSHGLFDYESRNIAKKNIRTDKAGTVARIDDEVEFYPGDPAKNAVLQQMIAVSREDEASEGVSQILRVTKREKSNSLINSSSLDDFFVETAATAQGESSEALMSQPLAPMSQAGGRHPGDSDKLWLVIRSLKGPDGKQVSSYFCLKSLHSRTTR